MTVQPHQPLAGGARSAPLGRLRAAGAGRWAALRRLLAGRLPVVRFDAERHGLLLPQAIARPARRGDARPHGVELRLPASAVLRKSLRLPAAAAENLRPLLALEMDRETPFAAQSVWFGYRIARRDRNSLTVDLAVVPRPLFDDCMARLAALGLAARWIAVEAGAGEESVRFPLEDAAPLWRGVVSPTLLAAVLLLTLGLGLHDLMQARSFEADLAAARAAAERTLVLKRSLAGTGAAQAAAETSRAAILAALADALPDGIWLDRMSIDGSKVEISGFAPDAAALLVRLAQSPPFHDAHFLGATVRDAKTQRDHFQIALAVREDTP